MITSHKTMPPNCQWSVTKLNTASFFCMITDEIGTLLNSQVT